MTSHPSRIYLDNAATSWPKTPSVAQKMCAALTVGGSPGRSAHKGALEAARTVFASRKKIASFLGVSSPENLLFQPGCTQAANLVLKGFLGPDDDVLVSPVEHNSITRPLYELSCQNTAITWLTADSSGSIDIEDAEKCLKKKSYKAIVCQHGSNVSGAIQPIAELASLAHEYETALIVDGAQAGGHLPLTLDTLGVDAWFCSGHKGLGGPQGVGVLYLASDFEVAPLITGGTGSGGRDFPPNQLERPEAYEAGTQPLPCIAGLAGAIEDIAPIAKERQATEKDRTAQLHKGLCSLPTIKVLGPEYGVPRLPIISIVSEVIAPDTLAFMLDSKYGIAVRSGIHCAPAAHEVLGTQATGAVRFSPGPATTEEEIDHTINAVKHIVENAAHGRGL